LDHEALEKHLAVMERLGLGTVQFGQSYGISNRRGRVPHVDIVQMLIRAAEAGVGWLDTAADYGDAEAVLGTLREYARPFRIATKTASLKDSVAGVLARTRRSIEALQRKPVDLLLIHAAGDLLGPEGRTLWDGLLALRDEGLFRAIGISAYAEDDPAALARRFRPSAMQVPVSLLDQRLLVDGTLARLKELGVEIHARSLFLQGLLFLVPSELPPALAAAGPHLEAMRACIARAGATPLSAALGFVLSRPEIDVAVVGVTSVGELDEILDGAATPVPAIDWSACALQDARILTPSRW
jgi:aryl-alcohol dehydrogenase-like predicted oxidoreductase